MTKYDFSPEARERSRLAGIESRKRRDEKMLNDPEYAEKIKAARREQRRRALEKNPNLDKDQRARGLAKDPDFDRKKNAGQWEKIKADPRLRELRSATVRRNHLKRRFGMTVEDWDHMWANQGGCCAICKKPLTPGHGTHVDHDHTTGAVRSLLCLKCNTALGKVHEDEQILKSMTEYVRKHAADRPS